MKTPYHTLVVRDAGRWSPQFGDYSRKVVAQEREDSYNEYRKRDVQIIATNDGARDIEAAVAALNAA